jgi:hypothetical protein
LATADRGIEEVGRAAQQVKIESGLTSPEIAALDRSLRKPLGAGSVKVSEGLKASVPKLHAS